MYGVRLLHDFLSGCPATSASVAARGCLTGRREPLAIFLACTAAATDAHHAIRADQCPDQRLPTGRLTIQDGIHRSEEHTSELQSLMRISYAVFCLKKQNIRVNTVDYENSSNHTTRNTK